MQKYLRTFTTFFTILYLFSSAIAPALAAVSYLYDANGNMTSNGTDCFEYNEANQLKKVKKCATNEVIAEYVYDYKGNRIIKKVYANGTLQKTAYSPTDDYETVKLASNSAVQNTSYYFANNQLIAKKDHTGKLTYFHNDHLGSTQVITDTSGNLVENTSYDPWGEIAQGGTQSKFLYTGQENDPETNLHYYNARYYDPHIRRFTQPDDIIQNIYDPQSLNRYSYVRNNPIINTDPTGHYVETALDIAFIASDVILIQSEGMTVTNVMALSADVIGAALPGLTGGGVAVRAIAKSEKIAQTIKASKITTETVRYYDSMRAFKKAEGSAGIGFQWHHIVEQHASNISKFGEKSIHNTQNVIKVPTKVNQKLNGIYSSKYSAEAPKGLRLRDFIKTKSYNEQYQTGLNYLNFVLDLYSRKKF